jgi:hypothetical protein
MGDPVSITMGALTAANASFNMLKLAIAARDDIKAQEHASALLNQIIAAHQNTLAIQTEYSALLARKRELEEKASELENWRAQSAVYDLKDFGGETFAYVYNGAVEGKTPPHKACPTCYQKRVISILSGSGRSAYRQDIYHCHTCKSDIHLGARDENAWKRLSGGNNGPVY